MKCLVLFFLLCISHAFSINSNPKVIIIGAGPAGIAAASKLIQNGINDVTILEAENRYGGRINSTKIGEYWADLGAQWVHGEVGNVAYELASPLGLLSKSRGPGEPEEPPLKVRLRGSSGTTLSADVSDDVAEYLAAITDNYTGIEDLKTGSYGEYIETKFTDWFEKHPEISADLHKPLLHSMELVTMAAEGADDWNKVSILGSKNAPPCPGFAETNWKEKTYGTILDIMIKRYPNPEEELPVLNKTQLNKKVSKVNYAGDGPVTVTTTDGKEYTADHVIFTPSLGVLKADHEKVFEPPLPAKNKNAIERLGMGKNGKILMYYENPWWEPREVNTLNAFFWTEEDRKEIENDPEKSWMLGITYDSIVEYKPKLYFLWMSGPYAEQMERIPDEQFKNQTIELLQRFLGLTSNITEPTEIKRSFWNTNENFRGTYSFPTMQSVDMNSGPNDLGAPIMRKGVPVIQFAGEATDSAYYSNVHGAIASGWREADRLIKLY